MDKEALKSVRSRFHSKYQVTVSLNSSMEKGTFLKFRKLLIKLGRNEGEFFMEHVHAFMNKNRVLMEEMDFAIYQKNEFRKVVFEQCGYNLTDCNLKLVREMTELGKDYFEVINQNNNLVYFYKLGSVKMEAVLTFIGKNKKGMVSLNIPKKIPKKGMPKDILIEI